MIVALDPKGVRVVLVELDHAGIPAVDHLRPLDREDEFLQEDLGGLVTAMFGPRLAEALELYLGGVAAESVEVSLDPPHFVDAERETHPIADLAEFERRGVPQGDVMEREREAPPPDSLAQPFASIRTIARDTLCFSFDLGETFRSAVGQGERASDDRVRFNVYGAACVSTSRSGRGRAVEGRGL